MSSAAGRVRGVDDLLDALLDRGALGDRAAAEQALARCSLETRLPVYARVLAGIGAFFAALCFAVAVALVDVVDLDSAPALLSIAAVLVAAAVPLRRAAAGIPGTVRSSFVLQLSVFTMAAGKTLLVWGVTVGADSPWALPAGAALATLVTWRIYPSALDRFGSTFATIVLLAGVALWQLEAPLARDLVLHGIAVAGLAASGLALLAPRAHAGVRPLGHAALLGLVAVVVALTAPDALVGWRIFEGAVVWPLRAALAAAVAIGAGVAARSAIASGRLRTRAALGAAAGAVLVAAIAAPGISLALLLLVVGHARHERVLLGCGLVLLPLFLWLYYYSLDLDLATKAGVLVTSGLVLLAGRALLARAAGGSAEAGR